MSCRPDFTVLIYPAYLTQKDQGDRVSPPSTIITSNTPPTFISISQDDPVRVDGPGLCDGPAAIACPHGTAHLPEGRPWPGCVARRWP